ncbi:glycosyltransferase family 9 protein [Comamonas sp. NLF-1-9]|uniref:glycosyltransferase family 9 protein n=1 Tax=Comamonas sp. NLF-1-9 TaxID=2853163 RepID=UPI001C456C08|nr:glycosyltransferase family 9 protein [Comamonas sp. NLF-1-9]QXL85287.1 glycosyltransferase family 9 protein [Comamonas sp. NLF-1-9]
MNATASRLGPVRRIVVFRALMLGDMLCATPVLRAVRATWPQARITLVGLPWAASWAQRLASVDAFEAFPGWPGLPETPPAPARQLLAFLNGLREQRFDLAIQLHGSGVRVNPLVARFGAARNAGFAGRTAWIPPGEAERFALWPEEGHEIQRLLRLADHLGLERRGTEIDWALRPRDLACARRLLPAGRSHVVVHAGAQLPSRRWGVRRFAAVADRLAQAGLRVVLTGTQGERELVASVASAMREPALNLCARTDLWTLGGLLSSARLLLCNDTGLSHVAAALGTPSVVVACGSDTRRWAPLDTRRHRVLWHDMPCRPCGHRNCPVGHGCASGVSVDSVTHAALAMANGANT